ncbi:hypothetical protein [Longivirga aurantiaca]|uniref:Uncharacterized protein n=1 Tax=Longivirga aurantiaca TaxID=1837743 RepID=A0ABW1T496_9ACTN
MTGPGDGRLDLDDLGSVIEGASSVDRPSDVVGDDAGSAWKERLDDAGITPWLRRHRVVVGIATVAVVALGVGTTAWLGAQPPPRRDATVDLAAATVDEANGPYLSVLEPDLAVAAYLATTDDPTVSVRVDALEGPGIRASSVGAPQGGGNPDAAVVRAVIGCTDDAIRATTRDFHLRVTTTDAWGRERSGMADLPSTDFGWAEYVRQTCWQQAVAGSVRLGDVRTRIDVGAAAVALQMDVVSTMPFDALLRIDGAELDRLRIPWTGDLSGLVAGGTKAVDARLEVTDCAPGTPDVPRTWVPDSLGAGTAYSETDGIAVVVATADQLAGAQVPLRFTQAQSAVIRRALAAICADTPAVTLSDLRVVRRVADPAFGTTSLTMTAGVTVTDDRTMKVGVSQDPSFGTPAPGQIPWATLPPGGGTATVTWTFECTVNPAPPSVVIRFVDGLRPTPLTVPLDQETVAPWVSDACPLLTPDTLVELGWSLP